MDNQDRDDQNGGLENGYTLLTPEGNDATEEAITRHLSKILGLEIGQGSELEGAVVAEDDIAAHLSNILEQVEPVTQPEPPLLPAVSESTQIAISKAAEDQSRSRRKRLCEEGKRWDYLLRMQKTMNETFDNPSWMHPHGMTEFDVSFIPESRQQGLKDLKVNIRRQNYIYMNQHPELEALLALFYKKLLRTQPADSVKYAAEFFTFRIVDEQELHRLVDEELVKLRRFHNPNWWKESCKASQTEKEVQPPRPRKIKKPKPKKHVYCGCKDPGRLKKVVKEIVQVPLPPKKLPICPPPL